MDLRASKKLQQKWYFHKILDIKGCVCEMINVANSSYSSENTILTLVPLCMLLTAMHKEKWEGNRIQLGLAAVIHSLKPFI